MALKPGDCLELGVWMDGRETEEMKLAFVNDLRAAFSQIPVVTGPLVMTELRPGDARVPPLPKGLSGPDVKFLVGEAEIISVIEENEGYFLADLDPKDLERLVAITRRVYQKLNPGKPEYPLEKCYESINQQGPEAALAALREQLNVTVH